MPVVPAELTSVRAADDHAAVLLVHGDECDLHVQLVDGELVPLPVLEHKGPASVSLDQGQTLGLSGTKVNAELSMLHDTCTDRRPAYM